MVAVYFHDRRQHVVKLADRDEEVTAECDHVRRSEPTNLTEEPVSIHPWKWSLVMTNLQFMDSRQAKRLALEQIEKDSLDVTEEERERIVSCLKFAHKKESWADLGAESAKTVKNVLSKMFPIEDVFCETEPIPNMAAHRTCREFVDKREAHYEAFDDSSSRWKNGISLNKGKWVHNGIFLSCRCYKYKQEAEIETVVTSIPQFEGCRGAIKKHLMHPFLPECDYTNTRSKLDSEAKEALTSYWEGEFPDLQSVDRTKFSKNLAILTHHRRMHVCRPRCTEEATCRRNPL